MCKSSIVGDLCGILMALGPKNIAFSTLARHAWRQTPNTTTALSIIFLLKLQLTIDDAEIQR